MAEPFSLAAGIFSALQFLDRLVVLSKTLSSSLSEESSEIRAILRELETLRSILQLFRQEIEHEQQTDGAVRRLEYLHQPVQDFEQQLTELSQCLQSLSVRKTGGVRWVFSHQKRVEKQMEKIQRFKLIFSSAFTADDRSRSRHIQDMLEEHRQDFLGYQENSTEMLSKILYHVQSSNIDNANGADNSVSAGRKRKGVHSDTDPQDRSRRTARLSGSPLIGIPDHLDENSASTPRACSTSIFDTRSDKLEELVSEVPSVESDTGPGVSVAMGQGRIRETDKDLKYLAWMWKKLEPTEKLFAIHDKRMSVWDSSWDWAENFIKEFKTAYEDALKAAGHLHSPSSVVDLNGLSTKLLDAELHSVDSNNAEELPRLITHYEKKGDFLMAQILQERLLSADSENSRLDSETVLIICNLLALYGIVSDEIEQVARRLGLNTTMMTKIAPPIHRTVAQNNKRLMTMFLRHRMSEETDFVGRSVYHAAMENRASSSLEVLLALKGSKGLNGKDLFERQPLCVAAEFGFEDCLRLIHNPVAHIDLSANATWYKDGKLVKAGKWNPLHIAAQHGHLGMVQRLLAAGMDVNALAAYRSGRTALQAASEAGYAPLVRFLLNSGADINAPAASEDGLTALQAVAMRGDLQLVTLFINAGAKVNASPGESGGRTALQAAAQNGHLHVCELLLTKGAHINAKPAEFDGRTALQAAAQGGHEKIVHMLHRKGAYINAPASPGGLTAVQAAAKGGSIEVVRFLIQHNADIDAAAEPNRGLTALEAAAENGHIEMVRLLITMGARVHHPAPVGKPTWKWLGTTAIQAAAISGDIEVVHELLKKGADVNARAPGECAIVTPLQAAASHGQLELTQFLISQGADINSPASNNSGFTALQAAAEGGHLAVVNFLLEKCADVNAPPSKYHGKTALQAAAANGHVKIVRALLNAGADIDGTGTVGCDYERTSVIDSAIGRGNVGIVKLLLEVNDGSDKICMDEALRLAVNTGHEVIAEMLKSYGAADATAEYT